MKSPVMGRRLLCVRHRCGHQVQGVLSLSVRGVMKMPDSRHGAELCCILVHRRYYFHDVCAAKIEALCWEGIPLLGSKRSESLLKKHRVAYTNLTPRREPISSPLGPVVVVCFHTSAQ